MTLKDEKKINGAFEELLQLSKDIDKKNQKDHDTFLEDRDVSEMLDKGRGIRY